MTATSWVEPLSSLGVADAGRVGRKAAVLGELLRAGFPVPAGFVLPGELLTAEDGGAQFPAEVLTALSGVASAIDAPLAVRSSSVAEDLADASFAGQYESVLDVIGTAELVEAVRACVSSASAGRVAVYRDAKGSEGSNRMSVLIQRLVDADAAGVAFTANPVTGDRGEVVINAVGGLGERLVSGAATADHWSVRGGHARLALDAEQAITAAQAVEVAELARKVEGYFGAPQDIEWAIGGGVLWLLQARPITALPDPADEPGAIAIDVPPGEWTRSNYAPEPLSPMFRSLMLPGLHELTENLFPYSIGERIEFCEIGGWLYTRFVKADSPERIKAKLGRAIAAVAADEPADFYRDWFTVSEPRLTARLTELRDDCVPAELPDQDLLDHLDAVHATWRETLAKHFRCGGSGTFVLGELGVTCRDLLGWDAPDTLALLLGLGGKTTEPAYALAGLVALVRARPWVAELIPALLESEVDGDDVLHALRGSDRRFADAFAAYQHEYGQRTLGMDITEPTVAERPALVLSLIQGQLSRNFDPEADQEALLAERAKAEAAARAALAGASTVDQGRFEQVLARAQWAHPGRDDSHYLTQLAGGLLRRAVLELGRRLAERELIGNVEDVFLLHHFEAHNSLLDDIDRRALIGDRAAEQAWAIAHPGPESYGTQGGHGFNPADLLATLPPPARRLVEAGLWAWQEVSGERAGNTAPVDSDGLTLRGIAGSRGRYTGRVRVITSEADFGRLQPGEVLVCPETNPQWAVLFPSIGALVTDHGGLLSHPAIIAREYRVPAVLATGIATKHLRDGQIVDVDGTTGTVEIVVP